MNSYNVLPNLIQSNLLSITCDEENKSKILELQHS